MEQSLGSAAPEYAGRTVPAIRRTVAVFDLLAQTRRTLSLSEISRRLGLPKSSVHRILATLEQQDCVQRNGKTGRFSLGTKLLTLNQAALEGAGLRELATPFLTSLRRQTGLTVHMAIQEHNQAVLIAKLEPPGQPTVGTWVGRAMDLNSTAAGKALIAHLTEPELARQFHGLSFVRHNERTIVGLARLQRELAGVREAGYALDDEEDELGSRCIGAPLLAGGRVVASISLAGSIEQVRTERVPLLAACIRSTAAHISSRLTQCGYSPTT